MRRYHVKIYLSNNSFIDEKTEAESLEEAVDMIMSTDKVIEIIGNNEVESVQMIDSEELEPIPPNRFLVQESSDLGYWLITDIQNSLVCKFLERQYYKDYKITDLNGTPITDLYTLANALSDMGEYLHSKHPELIC